MPNDPKRFYPDGTPADQYAPGKCWHCGSGNLTNNNGVIICHECGAEEIEPYDA